MKKYLMLQLHFFKIFFKNFSIHIFFMIFFNISDKYYMDMPAPKKSYLINKPLILQAKDSNMQFSNTGHKLTF